MRDFFVDNALKIIKKHHSNYDNLMLDKIKYGLESLYILITKTIFIFSLAYLLGIIKEFIIFMVLYNIIRMPSFGLHASKSWICLIGSTLIFILSTVLCQIVKLPIIVKSLIGIICILYIFKYAPADTHKRPIIDKKRRKILKTISAIIAIIFVIIALLKINNFISNALIMALIIQSLMISPFVYRMFKLPYNNYLQYGVND